MPQLLRLKTLCPIFLQEFEIELEGSQSLRILCYEKCYDKTKVNKDNNEIVDKIMGKGQIQVRVQGPGARPGELPGSVVPIEKAFSYLVFLVKVLGLL